MNFDLIMLLHFIIVFFLLWCVVLTTPVCLFYPMHKRSVLRNKTEVLRNSIPPLLSLIIKEDGIVTEKEKDIISDYFQIMKIDDVNLSEIFFSMQKSFEEYLSGAKTRNYKICCVSILELGITYESRLILLTVLFQLAYAHEGIVYTELSLLRNIARFLLIKKADRIELEEKYGIKEEKKQPTYTYYSNRDEVISNAYSALGLEKTAKKEDIKKAYRRMALIYHPDRLPSNATQEDIEVAEEKFRQINEAYKCLKIENRIS